MQSDCSGSSRHTFSQSRCCGCPSLRVITVSPRTELQHSARVRHHSLHTPEGGQVHAGSLLSNRVRARARVPRTRNSQQVREPRH